MLLQGFSLKGLKHLVLDEADRLLNMDFEAEIDQILRVIPRERRTQLFSATMTSKVRPARKIMLPWAYMLWSAMRSARQSTSSWQCAAAPCNISTSRPTICYWPVMHSVETAVRCMGPLTEVSDHPCVVIYSHTRGCPVAGGEAAARVPDRPGAR